LLSDLANCTVLRVVVVTQYRRVTDGQTDGQTDGIAVASTALARRTLRRAVKTTVNSSQRRQIRGSTRHTILPCDELTRSRNNGPVRARRRPENFRSQPMPIVAKRLDGSGSHLLRRHQHAGHIVLVEDPAPPFRGGRQFLGRE